MNTRRLENVPLTEIAAVVRSKNSGPFELTLDVMTGGWFSAWTGEHSDR